MSKPSTTPDIGFTPWFKSSYSQPSESACVEIRFRAGQVGVRDSKAPDEGRLAFRGGAWSQFRTWVSAGSRSDTAAS
ncbi:DUF397 domain-containing protein [Lentzea kentuckyensis]|uniref:DUF397 domain-containing protein n=1 Tax=Lentzea kentuckyensis TaxID=360086 RepID=UPI000A388667|nr:DUF397 domain-containing protein [Lentzea kentuckyensis]